MCMAGGLSTGFLGDSAAFAPAGGLNKLMHHNAIDFA